jgi:hypothetical protein
VEDAAESFAMAVSEDRKRRKLEQLEQQNPKPPNDNNDDGNPEASVVTDE